MGKRVQLGLAHCGQSIVLFRVLSAVAFDLQHVDAAVVQQAYLKASNTSAGDSFGFSVGISGDTLVVGAKFEAGGAIGVNGEQKMRTSRNAGAAYVFVRSGTNWVQQAYLKPSNTGPGDAFGTSVAISGDTIVVGAEWDGSVGFHAPRKDSKAREAGSAFVFVRKGTNWMQQAVLKASNATANHGFGHCVAISGNIIVVGAINDASSSPGVNGDQRDTRAPLAGAAYVFVREQTNWIQEAYLKASNPDNEDRFGISASVSGNTIIVGAWGEDSKSPGVNGDQADNSVQNSGAAYIFVRNGTNWSQQAYLKASNPGVEHYFGKAVAISGDLAVIGSETEQGNAAGVNWAQTNNFINSGAAYVFVREGTNWSQQAYLKAPKHRARVHMAFGASVAASAQGVVVGAVGEASGIGGINGNPNNTNAPNSGAAYVFKRKGTNWITQYYLKASNPDGRSAAVQKGILGRFRRPTAENSDQFGWSVSASGNTVVVGAIGEASRATGIDGNQSDNSAPGAGAAYVFDGIEIETEAAANRQAR